jgi:hypothetical protein
MFLSQKIVFFAQNPMRRAFARAHRRSAQQRTTCADRGGSSGGKLPFLIKMKPKNPRSDYLLTTPQNLKLDPVYGLGTPYTGVSVD